MSKEKGSQFLLAEYVNNRSIWLNSQILKSSVQLLNEINDPCKDYYFVPINHNNDKKNSILSNNELDEILDDGMKKTSEIAKKKYDELKKLVGLQR